MVTGEGLGDSAMGPGQTNKKEIEERHMKLHLRQDPFTRSFLLPLADNY